MSENIQSENTVKIDIEEVKKPGWEHGKASSGPLPGHGGTDLRDAVIKLEPGWTPQVASGGILAGPGSRPYLGSQEAIEEFSREAHTKQEDAKEITRKLLVAAEQERMKREGR